MALQLDLRHYETVVAIVEMGTMTAAAKELLTTQSALSHRLTEAERRLGAKLFERGPNRRLKPTRAGLVVHQSASRALSELERSEALLLNDRTEVTAVVRIAVGSYDCYHWFPDLVSSVRRSHPEIELELVVVGDTPGDALAAGTADIVIAPGEPEGPFVLRHLFDDELVLVVGPEHPLGARTWIESDALADETYFTYNLAPAPGFEYDRFIRTGTIYPSVVTVVPQTSAITELVAAGAGVAILSRWALAPAIESGRVRAVRCGQAGLTLGWQAMLRPADEVDSPAQRVADLLATNL